MPLHITTHNGYGDCDDCGMYEHGHFAVTFADGTTLGGNHDGHLGGGNWAGDLATILPWTLQKLGCVVQVLNLTTEAIRDQDYPEYPHYTRIQLPALSGQAPVALTYAPPDDAGDNAGWDGDWSAILRKLLEQRVELSLVATNED